MTGLQVLAEGLRFPEGPAFAPDGSLWFVELGGGTLVRWCDGTLERHLTGGAPNGLAFDRSGTAHICDADGDRVITWHDGTITPAVVGDDGAMLPRPNDLAFDRAGSLVFTCPGVPVPDTAGMIWCRRRDGTLACVSDSLHFPNGLAFGPGGDMLYVCETFGQRVWKGRWDAVAARWCDPVPLCETGGPVGPDGMAIDATGRLFVAVYGLGVIRVFAPSGQPLEDIAVGSPGPTNCAFDPSGRLGLVVTDGDGGRLLADRRRGPGLPISLP